MRPQRMAAYAEDPLVQMQTQMERLENNSDRVVMVDIQ